MSNWHLNYRQSPANCRLPSKNRNRERKSRKKKGRSSVPGTVQHARNAVNGDHRRTEEKP